MVNYIYGLGGRDTNPTCVYEDIFEDLTRIAKTGHVEKQVTLFRIKGVRRKTK